MLKLRRHRQDQAERAVAERLRELGRAQQGLAEIDAQITGRYHSVRQGGLSGAIDARRLVGNRVYLNHLHALRLGASRKIDEEAKRVAEARATLAEARKQTEIMVKLRENAERRYRAEQARRERIELDELSTAKYAWRHQLSNREAS